MPGSTSEDVINVARTTSGLPSPRLAKSMRAISAMFSSAQSSSRLRDEVLLLTDRSIKARQAAVARENTFRVLRQPDREHNDVQEIDNNFPQGHGISRLEGPDKLASVRNFSEVGARHEEDHSFDQTFDEGRFRRIIQNLPDTVFRIRETPTYSVEFVNQAGDHLLGVRPGAVELCPALIEAAIGPQLLEAARRAVYDGIETSLRGICNYRRPDGSIRYMETSMSVLFDDIDTPGYVVEGVIRDVTDAKQNEQTLTQQAMHDPLTGLANRTQFMRRLDVVLRERGAEEDVAVLFVDLDHFKLVNDTMGHQVGNQLLVSVAHRLRTAVRPQDLVARFGGDEFVILLEGLEDLTTAITVAERITDAVSAAGTIDGIEGLVTPSVGIAVSGADANTADLLLHNADEAMYRAKREGRACWRVYDDRLREQAQTRIADEKLLRKACQLDDLLIDYRPEVRISDLTLIGVRNSVRWLHPQRGLVDSAEFADLAEATGLIVEVGNCALARSAADFRRWTNLGITSMQKGLRLHVPLTARQLNQPGLITGIRELAEIHQLPLGSIWFDIAELTVVRNPEMMRARIESLASLGAQVSIDEFGEGASSLRYISQFPISGISISMSYLETLIVPRENDRSRAEDIIHFALTSGLEVRVFDVNSASQLELVRSLGVTSATGRVTGGVVSASQMVEILRGEVPLLAVVPPRTSILANSRIKHKKSTRRFGPIDKTVNS